MLDETILLNTTPSKRRRPFLSLRPTRQTTFLALLAYAVYLLLLQPPLCGSVSVTEGKADVWRRPRPWPRHHSNAEASSVFEFSTLDAAEAGSPRSLDDDIDGDNFLTDIIYAFIFGGKAGINGQTATNDEKVTTQFELEPSMEHDVWSSALRNRLREDLLVRFIVKDIVSAILKFISWMGLKILLYGVGNLIPTSLLG